jgi:anti-sigma regulatory factor (Ser/Thr protein kinase)
MAVDDRSGDRSAGDRVWSLVVPHHPRGARLGRQHFAAALRDLVPTSLLNDAVAVVAELLGNAVRHAEALPGGVIRLAWRIDPPVVTIMVTDGGSVQEPVAREAALDAVEGRGLAIVAALAQQWGVQADDDGQCVWAALGTAVKPSTVTKAPTVTKPSNGQPSIGTAFSGET